jgi:hypothetical protein
MCNSLYRPFSSTEGGSVERNMGRMPALSVILHIVKSGFIPLTLSVRGNALCKLLVKALQP